MTSLLITDRVVLHIGRGTAEVDDGSGAWTGGSERVDVSHDVMTCPPLLLRRPLEVDIRHLLLHLTDLLIRDGQPQRLHK